MSSVEHSDTFDANYLLGRKNLNSKKSISLEARRDLKQLINTEVSLWRQTSPSSFSIHDLRLINSLRWASSFITWEKMSLNKVLCLIHLGLIYHSATDTLEREMVVNGRQSCSWYLIYMINVELLLSKVHYRDRVRRRELWLSVRLLKLQMRHISNATHSKTASSHSRCWGPFHICDWARQASACDHPAKRKQGGITSVFMSVCGYTVYIHVCVFNVPNKNPVTFTAHCVPTFPFTMTTSHKVEQWLQNRGKSERTRRKRMRRRRKRKIKGKGKVAGRAEGRWRGGWTKGRKCVSWKNKRKHKKADKR